VLLLDVNVVLAAHRDDHPHHERVRGWFDRLLAGDEPFGVPFTVWASFLRLATNRRVFPRPTPRSDAFEFLAAVRAQPHHVATEPGRRHFDLLQRMCQEADASGDLLPDAVLAAVAVEHGCTVVSLDRDFARFPTVDTVRPGDG